MEIKTLSPGDSLWDTAADFAEGCGWPAGADLAQRMRLGDFHDWEHVFLLTDGETIVGFCALSKTDRLVKAPYCPYVSFLYIDSLYRGSRLSLKLIDAAQTHARANGFDRIFLVSSERGLYEKFGFSIVDQQSSLRNPLKTQSIFMREAQASATPIDPARNFLKLALYLLAVIALWVIVAKIAFPT